MRTTAAFLFFAFVLAAQTGAPIDLNSLKELKYRSIGPFRGGRADTVAGIPSQPNVYYFGATGGGIWKTTDGGSSWQPVADGQLKTGSVGAIAVSESDPNIIYAGMGEPDIRGNASPGDGVYKSTDAGKTWKNIGLEDTQQIGAVRIHPKNPDIAYIAALGHQFGPNEQRGIFRTTDGGKTWKQIYTRGPKAGAIDLVLDPGNPNVLYAGFWEVYRTPWSLESGGPGSGVFKSSDGGDTWTDLTRAPGMPKGLIGRVGITVSGVSSDRVWALVEAEDGGVFRSDNAGKTWTKISENRNLRQRAWYYSRIFADPRKLDTVYVTNVGFYRSDDGGKTYTPIRTPHGDNHYLWIAPNDGNRMIECNDGGATITTNGGRTWTSEDQQPTAQFYRVALDNDFPYHAYGAQQDNSTVRTATRGSGAGITEHDWYPVGGGESGWIQPDPKDSEVVYAGSYDGLITRQDHHTGQLRNITVWPDNPMGYPAADLKYRFQWDFPLFLSPHDPTVLYAAGNVLFRTTNQGQSWDAISSDLTRNDKSKQGSSGGPITKDNTSIEYYSVIFTGAESPLKKGLIWVGSDDGLIHVTQDGGKHWSNVTPKGLPEWSRVNDIEPSPHDPGTAYFAATKYQLDDFQPLLYKTTDYGKTWTKIIQGIPARSFTRTIREDPNRAGLLVAGTEFGIYVSFSGGQNWQSFQLNLPIVPITDLAFHKREKELVVATQGRAFWILDDLPLLYQLAGGGLGADSRLFQPKDPYRTSGGGFRLPPNAPVGQNPASGAVVFYSFKEKPQGEVTLELLDNSGKLIKKFSSKKADIKPEPAGFTEEEEDTPPQRGGSELVPVEAGLNRFTWDLHYPDAAKFPGLIMWAGSVRGPSIVPGDYQVRLTANGKSQTQKFHVMKDPRLSTTPEDFARQLELGMQVRDKLGAANEGVIEIREIRKQLDGYIERTKDQKVVNAAKALSKKLTEVEEALYQTKNRASEDPLNYPIKLNNKLAALGSAIAMSDSAPTTQESMVYEGLASQVNAEIRKLDQLLSADLAAFNKLVRDENIPAITVHEHPSSP
ncbi:MAG: WD40/YVTN/BNR-like repeat-containing protein [Bryobacteraceae bacterium]